MLEVGQRLTNDQRFGVLFSTSPGYYQNFTWYPFMWQGGAEIQVPETNTSGMRDPGAVQALKFWQDAVNLGVSPRTELAAELGMAPRTSEPGTARSRISASGRFQS